MSSPSRSPSPVSLAAVSDPGSFRGFPPAALEFYRRLAADNSKTFWADQRSVYDEAVRGPLEALAAEVEDRYGEFRIFRPNRDVRFSTDKEGRRVTDKQCTPQDFQATIGHAMGLPVDEVVMSPSNRPFTVGDKGAPAIEIFA